VEKYGTALSKQYGACTLLAGAGSLISKTILGVLIK
jgi:hypothetical protein